MMTPGPNGHQTSLFGNDLLQQLDPQDSLLVLAAAIPWKTFELEFTRYYVQGIGRPSKPIRLLVGLLILKQLENLSDEQVVLAFKRNPYYQAFCGLTEFSLKLPWTSYLPSVSRCTARRHSKALSTSTPRFRKKTSPTRPMANWRSRSSTDYRSLQNFTELYFGAPMPKKLKVCG